MNKYLHVLINIVLILCGMLLLFCTLSFILNLSLFVEVGHKLNIPYAFMAVIVFVTFGVGVNLSVDLLRISKTRWSLVLLFLFALFFLILQLGLTVLPVASSCKCTSFSEAIMRVSEWNQVYWSLTLLLFSVVSLLLMKYDKRISTIELEIR